MDEKVVHKFLSRFHESRDIDDVFTSGCCFWFAEILRRRFQFDGAEIMYDPTINHFGTKIGDHIYDVTGCIDGKYDMVPWLDYFDDKLERQRIIRDCINF